MNALSKKIYNAPALTVVTFSAERGFAMSLQLHPIDIEIDYALITNYTVANNNNQQFGNPNGPTPVSNNFWNF